MSSASRRNALIAVVLGLGGLVAADRLGWLPAASSDDETDDQSTTPRSTYLSVVERDASERALLEAAESTSRALESASQQWQQVRAQCVVGKTAELAEASFRERILSATKDLGVTNANAAPVRIETAPTPAGTKDADTVLRPVALRVQFDTDKPQDIYRIVDVLENLPDIQTAITQVSLSGPGLPQVPNTVTAAITIRAIAVVGEAP